MQSKAGYPRSTRPNGAPVERPAAIGMLGDHLTATAQHLEVVTLGVDL